MGKSTELRRHYEHLDKEGAPSIWVSGTGYSDQSSFLKATFEDERFQDWVCGTGILHLLFDGLDESRNLIPNVHMVLLDGIRKTRRHLARLRLRISCRSTEWTEHLEKGLRDLWGNDSVRICTLEPLTDDDIATGARDEGVDPRAFLGAVSEKNLRALASRPITLELLLKSYEPPRGLPDTQTELYAKGCLKLCDDLNEDRRDAWIVGTLSPAQRYAIARRIAAVLVLSNRAAIHTGPVLGEDQCAEVALGDIEGGDEHYDRIKVDLTTRNIREALTTGLFCTAGPARVAFAHRNLAEYLAADYLLSHDLPSNDILQEIRHHKEKQVVPQLRGLAAWLACRDERIFESLLPGQALVILRGDVASLGEEKKLALLEQLLTEIGSADSPRLREAVPPELHKLKCEGLGETLLAWLTDKKRRPEARRAALDVARECGVTSLWESTVKVALDRKEDPEVREAALVSLREAADGPVLRRLRPIALAYEEHDACDELKGMALHILWPRGYVDVRELFESLTDPKRERMYGEYRRFLRSTLSEHLSADDVIPALNWAARQTQREAIPAAFEAPIDAIMSAGVSQWDRKGVPDRMGKLLTWKCSTGRPVDSSFRGTMDSIGAAERRGLISKLVEQLAQDEAALYSVAQLPGLLRSGDLSWLLRQARLSTADGQARAWARLARDLYLAVEIEDPNELLLAAAEPGVIQEEFWGLLRPIDIHSKGAASRRRDYELSHEGTKEAASIRVDRQRRVMQRLEQLERGNRNAWWELNLEMLDWARTIGVGELEPDLRKSPAWAEAAETTRQRILDAGETFLRAEPPHPRERVWSGEDLEAALAGYRALYLLWHESPAKLNDLEPEIWGSWASILVGYPSGSSVQSDELQLVKTAYGKVPEEILKSLLIEIEHEDAGVGLSCLTRVSECWDEWLVEAVMDRIRNGTLVAERFPDLLAVLMAHGCRDALRKVESLFNRALAGRDLTTGKAMAVALLSSAPESAWGTVWPEIKKKVGMGREVLAQVERTGLEGDGFARQLSVEQSGGLLKWMLRPRVRAPKEPDSDTYPNQEAALERLRGGLLRRLIESGTWEAVEVLQGLNKNPHRAWVNGALHEATERALAATWSPLDPTKVLEWTLGGLPILDAARQRESDAMGFKLQIPIRITGGYDSKHRNVINVGHHVAPLSDRALELLIELVIENQKGGGGWIERRALVERKVLNADIKGGIRRLREGLGEVGHELIEADRKRRIRLSVHPHLVFIDTDRLARHGDTLIQRQVRRLRSYL
jgi:hypothetical protein